MRLGRSRLPLLLNLLLSDDTPQWEFLKFVDLELEASESLSLSTVGITLSASADARDAIAILSLAQLRQT